MFKLLSCDIRNPGWWSVKFAVCWLTSTVPRYILVRENMPVRGLGVDSTCWKCSQT